MDFVFLLWIGNLGIIQRIKFMEEKSLSYKTLRNIGFSFFGYSLPILFSIFITPVVVHKLGVVDYGVYVLVNTITGFLLLMDLGLGYAIMKYSAEYYALKDFNNLEKLVKFGHLIFFIFGIIGLSVFFLLGKYFLPFFNIIQSSRTHILTVFVLSGILFLFNSLNIMYGYIIRSLQRYDTAVTWGTIQLAIFNLATLILVLFGFKLKAIITANIFSSFLLVLVYSYYCKTLLPEIRLGFAWSKELLLKSYKFGFAVFFTNLSGNALVQLDRLIIPMFLGTAPLAYYSIPGNITQKTTGITGASTGIFFPVITSLLAQGDNKKIAEIYIKMFRNITLIAASMTVPIIIFGRKILFYWVGADFAEQGKYILIILAVTYFILAIYSPLINFILGLGKAKFLMKFSIFMAVINVLLLLVLVPKFGILGAAYAYLGAVIPVLWIFYWVERKFLFLHGSLFFYAKLYGKIIFTSVIFYLISQVLDRFIVNLFSLIIIGPLSVLLYLILYKVFGFFEKEDWQLYINFLKTFFQRLKGIKINA